MSSSEGAKKWVTRWKYEMTAKTLRPGIWGLRDGGFFLRTRVLDPRSGKFVEYQRVYRDLTLNQVEQEKHRLRSDARDLVSGRKQSPMLWSEYAESLFEAKVNEGRISRPRAARSGRRRSHAWSRRWGTSTSTRSGPATSLPGATRSRGGCARECPPRRRPRMDGSRS